MLVSKKKYQVALDEIVDLKRKLNLKEESEAILQKDYEMLFQKFNELKFQVEELNPLNISLTSLKSKEEELNKEIHNKTNLLDEIVKEIKESEINIRNLKIELDILNSEIENTAEDRFIKSSIIEQELQNKLSEQLEGQKLQIDEYNIKLVNIERELKNRENVIQEYRQIKKDLVLARDEKRLQEVAFYKNTFPFTTTEQFKDQLTENNNQQKEMIKKKLVVREETSWTVNGSIREGRKMATLNIKSLIRSFNIECDNAISSLKYSNFETVVDRINKSFDTLNKLNKKNGLEINEEYLQLKIDELKLIYELKIFEQQEKEKLRILRAEQREQKRVEQEIKEKLSELNRYEKEIEKELAVLHKKNINSEKEDVTLMNKIKELYDSLELIEKKREEVEFRHLVGKSGYVYIISNIGTLGENVYKIGMTRRLEPLDRIRELSGAAVPFEYDIHAMILTDNAPQLENHLHSVFNDKRVNLINNRKEFFNVELQKIKEEVFSIVGKNIVFEDTPSATQYYQTLALKNVFEQIESDELSIN